MRFGSVCSGIEAASVAWGPLGWSAAWFAEIEPFPCAVLKHHYPEVENLGDMTQIPALLALGLIEAPDILCGGTPCQAFSVAGLRRSLDDARGNLSLTFCEIADAIDQRRTDAGTEPCIVFWENVPGVLNTKDNAFGCFLAGLAGEDEPLLAPGGKWANAGAVFGPARAVAWRVLDAQYFGVAQRRRRVFVVASARAGFDPAAVLFEFDGVRRDSAPRREAGEGAARGVIKGAAIGRKPEAGPQYGETLTDGSVYTLNCVDQHAVVADTTHTLRGEGFDASEDGTGRGTPLVPVAFSSKDYGADASQDLAPTLRAMNRADSHANGGGQMAVAWGLSPDTFDRTGEASTGTAAGRSGMGVDEELAYALRAKRAGGVATAMQVRRLTPRECERLQGFPDDYTLIPWRKKPASECPDGPRYKALGNSWAVPNVRWIGARIMAHVDIC